MKKRKKGVSNILVTIFLIVIAVILSFTIKSLIKTKNIEKSQMLMNCITDVDIKILDSCYENNLLKITVKNRKEIILGDFFLIQLIFSDSTSKTIPTPYHTYIYPYETKTIIVPYHQGLEKIKVIPRIESSSFLCMQNAPEFSGIKECKVEEK